MLALWTEAKKVRILLVFRVQKILGDGNPELQVQDDVDERNPAPQPHVTTVGVGPRQWFLPVVRGPAGSNGVSNKPNLQIEFWLEFA